MNWLICSQNILFVIFLLLSNCASKVQHGYNFQYYDNGNFAKNTTTRKEIILKMNEPTLYNAFHDDEFCYIGGIGRAYIFFRFTDVKYRSLCFTFDKTTDVITNIVDKGNLTIEDFKFNKQSISFNDLSERKVRFVDSLFSKFGS